MLLLPPAVPRQEDRSTYLNEANEIVWDQDEEDKDFQCPKEEVHEARGVRDQDRGLG